MGLLTGFWRYLVDAWDSFILLFPPWLIWLLALLAFMGYVFGIFSKIIDMGYRYYYDRTAPPIPAERQEQFDRNVKLSRIQQQRRLEELARAEAERRKEEERIRFITKNS